MITKEQALTILENKDLEKGLNAYLSIKRLCRETDVSCDRDFWRIYRAFYRMRRNDEFAEKYFAILQKYKNESETSFEKVFYEIYSVTDRCEVSFASKLLNLLDGRAPIWDSVLATKVFGYKLPYTYVKNRDVLCVRQYESYKAAFLDYVSSPEGKMLIDLFTSRFPDADISEVKKVDFILWKSAAL